MTFVPGQDGVVTDFVIEVTAGEDLSTNDAVYIDTSDGEAYKCDADDLTKIGFAGFVVAAATNGNTVRVLPWGIKGGFTSLTIGAIYYLSGTAGAITATKPSNYKMVAKALTATTVRIITEPTVRQRVYTADATWTKPAGLVKVFVQVQAAGGGSGVASNAFSCSGAGGAYTEGWFTADELSATEAVTVGEGGVGGVVGGTTSGQTGEASSFGSHAVADGGGGSAQNGGSATGGTVSTSAGFDVPGGDGNAAYENDDGSATATFNLPCPGLGYLSIWKSEIKDGGNDRDYSGPDAKGYGYGGVIKGQNSQPTAINGDDGADGVVIITEYY